MLENIQVLCHSSIRINKSKVIYIDPFKIDRDYNDADIIFITHDHYDHYSKKDIDKVKKEDTVIVLPQDLAKKAVNDGFDEENVVQVLPNNSYEIEGVKFETILAYNLKKVFHPKKNGWVRIYYRIRGSKVLYCRRYWLNRG